MSRQYWKLWIVQSREKNWSLHENLSKVLRNFGCSKNKNKNRNPTHVCTTDNWIMTRTIYSYTYLRDKIWICISKYDADESITSADYIWRRALPRLLRLCHYSKSRIPALWHVVPISFSTLFGQPTMKRSDFHQ